MAVFDAELGDNNPFTSYTLNNAGSPRRITTRSRIWRPCRRCGNRRPAGRSRPQVTAAAQTAYGYFGYDPRVGDLQVHDYDLTRRMDRGIRAALSIHGHIGDLMSSRRPAISAARFTCERLHLLHRDL
jgi:hypothetical protein